jgi:hypothetical protein
MAKQTGRQPRKRQLTKYEEYTFSSSEEEDEDVVPTFLSDEEWSD